MFLEELMVKNFFLLFSTVVIAFSFSACGTLQIKIEPSSAQQTAPIRLTETPVLLSPTPSVPPSATPDPLSIVFPKPGTVVLDFVAQACDARWANGAYSLSCPGDLNDLTQGYVAT